MSAEGFESLLTVTAAGSLAILGVLATRVLARRWFGAQVAYALWIAVPIVVVATLLPAPSLPAATVLNFVRAGVARTIPDVAVNTPVDIRPSLLIVWGVGALSMFAWLAWQQHRYLRSLGRLRVIGGARDTRIVRSESDAGGPALVGALRPCIVLPGDFEVRYAPRERELILAHERVHLARGDARINAFVAVLRCLNWFNPLIHVAAARFRFDQELACDAAVIARFPEARRPYADAMLKTQLAEQSWQELRLPVGCRWPSGHPLKERIVMLKQPMPTRVRRACGLVVVAAFGCCGAYVAAASQATEPETRASEDTKYRESFPPEYPQAALDAHQSGHVELKVLVDEHGQPKSAEVFKADPPAAKAMFGEASIAAVMQWKFHPARRLGQPVSGYVLVPIDFLTDGDAGADGLPPVPPPPPPLPEPPLPPPPPVSTAAT